MVFLEENKERRKRGGLIVKRESEGGRSGDQKTTRPQSLKGRGIDGQNKRPRKIDKTTGGKEPWGRPAASVVVSWPGPGLVDQPDHPRATTGDNGRHEGHAVTRSPLGPPCRSGGGVLARCRKLPRPTLAGKAGRGEICLPCRKAGRRILPRPLPRPLFASFRGVFPAFPCISGLPAPKRRRP